MITNREFKAQERVGNVIESREVARSAAVEGVNVIQLLFRLKSELEELQRLSQVKMQAKSDRLRDEGRLPLLMPRAYRVRELETALLRKTDSLRSLRT
eukprot:766190-Hanusia_phi.AAC.1